MKIAYLRDRRRSACFGIVLSGLLLSLQAWAAAPAADPVATQVQASGVQCTDAKAGKGCAAGDVASGDFYDVELTPGCGAQGFFAGVADAKGADALDRVPSTGSKAVATARFAQGQLVCVQAIGRAGQNPQYYFVTSVPASSVAACKAGSALCSTYGDRPIQHLQRDRSHACQPASAQCAQGWVSAKALDVFSNGL
ncbi:hypothetical protein [Stenotrophomonas sp.]|uniref:hypothetical protein n=1 Tax=Stenotrophomonas sp. TaxID=69392 RepID=UPI0028B211CE|nr:hypothetical protein [Stenotrophomonas sp.]